MNNKSVIATTIGFMCLGITIWMQSLGDAGWVMVADAHAMATGFALGSVVLGVMGILSFFHGRTLDSIIFFGGTGLFWTMHMGMTGDSAGTVGWFWLVWAIFFFYVWLSSFKAGWARSLFLLAGWLTLLAICLEAWTGSDVFKYIAGYIGLFTGLVGMYISAAEVLNNGSGKVILQTGAKDS